MKSPQLIISEHDPLKRRILISAAVVALIVAGYLLYDYGRTQAQVDYETLLKERELINAQIEKLTTELDNKQTELIVSLRGNEIDKQAYSEVNDSLNSMQLEILELKEEVAFYRSIVAPRESSRGLRIQRFKIVPTGKDRAFSYKLVLTQVIKSSRITRGTVDIQIEGVQNGKHKTMTLAEVSVAKLKQLKFKFKYFQSFEGDMIIPQGFVPSRVNIKVKSRRVTLDKVFSWAGEDLSSSGSFTTSSL